MAQVTIGVDIGLKGAIAALDIVDPTMGINTVTGEIHLGVRVWDMPTKKVKKLCTRGKMKTSTVYNIDKIHDILIEISKGNLSDDCRPRVVCFVEGSIIKPYGYNIKTSIGLARCQAIFEGLLSALHIEYHTIIPQKWQKAIGLTGKQQSGDTNIRMAQEKCPTIKFKTARGRVLDGRADALLLAEYGRSYWVKDENQS